MPVRLAVGRELPPPAFDAGRQLFEVAMLQVRLPLPGPYILQDIYDLEDEMRAYERKYGILFWIGRNWFSSSRSRSINSILMDPSPGGPAVPPPGR